MRPKDLYQFLTRAISARLPILITGAPGVGKSAQELRESPINRVYVANKAAQIQADLAAFMGGGQ